METLERVVQITGAAVLGAACVIAGPALRRLTARPLRVLITGAAGQVGYVLASSIAQGQMFGAHAPVHLHLFDVPSVETALFALKMELEDAAFTLLKDLIVSTNESEAFKDVDVAILIAGYPSKSGMKRTHIIDRNVEMYRRHGQALAELASKKVKVVVVANPANTNALILKDNAKTIPPENITCLTRVDHNRALFQISERLECHVSEVKNVIVWGNRSSTQYSDASHATVSGIPVQEVLGDEVDWIKGEFLTSLQHRQDDVSKGRNFSSAISTSAAICDHVRDWIRGTSRGSWVSMGVISDGSYGLPMDIMYSFPVTCFRGKWKIVQGLDVDDESTRKRLKATADELVQERLFALQCLGQRLSAAPSSPN
eukprot:g2675.t1